MQFKLKRYLQYISLILTLTFKKLKILRTFITKSLRVAYIRNNLFDNFDSFISRSSRDFDLYRRISFVNHCAPSAVVKNPSNKFMFRRCVKLHILLLAKISLMSSRDSFIRKHSAVFDQHASEVVLDSAFQNHMHFLTFTHHTHKSGFIHLILLPCIRCLVLNRLEHVVLYIYTQLFRMIAKHAPKRS